MPVSRDQLARDRAAEQTSSPDPEQEDADRQEQVDEEIAETQAREQPR